MRAFPTFTNEEAAAGMNGDGLDFVLQTATRPYGKGQVHVYIFEIPELFKAAL